MTRKLGRRTIRSHPQAATDQKELTGREKFARAIERSIKVAGLIVSVLGIFEVTKAD